MIVANMPSVHGPPKLEPDTVIVHAMAEFLDTAGRDYFAPDFLDRRGESAHAFITPSGVVIEAREYSQGAWHAREFNYNSLGVEFLVPGVHTYATFAKAIKRRYVTRQAYQAGVELVRLWVEWAPHGLDILRHSDVSPGRKIDPGTGFPWKRFLEDVRT